MKVLLYLYACTYVNPKSLFSTAKKALQVNEF